MHHRGSIPQVHELLAFEASARHRSFTRAAEELSLSQSAISHAIRLLEQRLGMLLFERVRQRVVPTAAANAYFAEIQPLLLELAAATGRVIANRSSERVLSLAVLPSFAQWWLIPRLPRFAAMHPEVTVNITTRLLPFEFADEPFDAAIHHGKNAWVDGSVHFLMRETMVPMCSPTFRKKHSIQQPADLANVTLLHQSTRPMAWPQWFWKNGVTHSSRDRGPTYDQFGMVMQAAASDLGVALLPNFLVERELQIGRLAVLFDLPVSLDSSYYFVLPQKGAIVAAENMRDWIRAEATAV